jgi:5-methylcytosine-specific restriction endonuclease McrA
MGSCISKKSVVPNTHVISTRSIKVIRKNAYKKKSIPKSLKKKVWDKWIGPNIGRTKCICCKHEEIRQIEFHCGHIIAEVNGGETNVDNLRPICAQCNLSMGSMSMDEFKKKYFK